MSTSSMIFGILLLLAGFVTHPGIPYQDPTPEILLDYNIRVEQADSLQLCGFTILIVSIVLTISAWIIKRSKTKQRS